MLTNLISLQLCTTDVGIDIIDYLECSPQSCVVTVSLVVTSRQYHIASLHVVAAEQPD